VIINHTLNLRVFHAVFRFVPAPVRLLLAPAPTVRLNESLRFFCFFAARFVETGAKYFPFSPINVGA
jgi:hypothetical protein